MEKTKKFDIKSIIFLSILAVSLIMVIVGICIPWISEAIIISSNPLKVNVINTETINDYFTKGLTETSGFWTMFSLALVTIVANAVVVVVYLISKFVKTDKFMPLWCLCIVVSFALLLCSVLTLFFTRTHIDAVYTSDKAGYYCYFGAGAWLLTAFGIVGGITGLAAFCCLAFNSRDKK